MRGKEDAQEIFERQEQRREEEEKAKVGRKEVSLDMEPPASKTRRPLWKVVCKYRGLTEFSLIRCP
jgi:hypothetical protein